MQEKLRNASQHVRHWNVQLNRLMTPITPGGAVRCLKIFYLYCALVITKMVLFLFCFCRTFGKSLIIVPHVSQKGRSAGQ